MRVLGTLVSGALAGVAAFVLQPSIAGALGDTDVPEILQRPVVQMAAIGIVTFLVLATVGVRLYRLVFGPGRPSGSGEGSRKRPSSVNSKREVDEFGVTWPVVVGRGESGDGEYAYAEDPKCPKCDTDVVPESEGPEAGGDAETWECPSCGYTRDRPADHLYHEHEIVEKQVDDELATAG